MSTGRSRTPKRSSSQSSTQNQDPNVFLVHGVPCDRSKTYTHAESVFLPRRGFCSRWWDKFQIEVGMNSFEPWEKGTTLVLFAVILTPVVWKLYSICCAAWAMLLTYTQESIIGSDVQSA